MKAYKRRIRSRSVARNFGGRWLMLYSNIMPQRTGTLWYPTPDGLAGYVYVWPRSQRHRMRTRRGYWQRLNPTDANRRVDVLHFDGPYWSEWCSP